MEVLISVPPTDFNFDSACSSPYISAPSSPKRFGSDFYFSAPTSPTRASAIYRGFNNHSFINRNSPNFPDSKPNNTQNEEDEDFAFDFSGQLGRTSLSADELFDGGKIRPLQLGNRNDEVSPRKKKSPISFTTPWSPKSPKKSNKPFISNPVQHERGRERSSAISSSNSRRNGTRSLSPYRDSWEEQDQITKPTKSSSKKWRLKDFLLFRSASEGRATEKDPFWRYKALSKRNDSSEGSGSGSGHRRKGQVSAHELHYRSNRASAEEMKRRTFLPYKQGLFGWLGFTPTSYGPSRGFTRG